MSFFFSWMDLHTLDIRAQANEALSNLSLSQFPQTVSLKQLLLGTSPPRFEVLDIIDLNEGRFKGLFKFKYEGEMHITLNSSVEINPLRLIEFDDFTKPHFVLANQSTVLPVDFDLRNVRIDAILTVVYNGKGITVVFNDSPIIDLDIKTSIDELLDDELFETMKRDTLTMATEFLKQDLPGLISQQQLFDDETQRLLEENMKSVVARDQGLVENERVSVCLEETELHKQEMDHNVFNTLSLEPVGFTDVVQRISLSQVEYQSQKLPERNLGVMKRRSIKMGKKKSKSKSSTPSTRSTSGMASVNISMNTSLNTIDESRDTIITTQHTPRPSTPTKAELLPPTITTSHASSPTLIDTSFSSPDSLEYLLSHETLVFDNDYDEEMEDPYRDITHPMDIVPGYEDEHKPIKHLIPETKMRPRGTSSNYMKFGDFQSVYDGRRVKSEVIKLD